MFVKKEGSLNTKTATPFQFDKKFKTYIHKYLIK